MRDFLDEATWGPIVNELDERARRWLNAHPPAWSFLTETVAELLKDKIPVSMKFVVEMARHNALKAGIGVRVSNTFTTYVRNLICVALPEAEDYLTGGRRKASTDDPLEL